MELKDFEKRCRTIALTIEGNVDQGVKNVANTVLESVVIATPVDEGTAVSNWIANIGSPSAGDVVAYAPGKGGSTTSQNEKAAIDKANSVIAQYKAGEDIHLTNNLEYIGALNDGSSTQAPAGFVQIAILKGIAAIKNIRILSKT